MPSKTYSDVLFEIARAWGDAAALEVGRDDAITAKLSFGARAGIEIDCSRCRPVLLTRSELPAGLAREPRALAEAVAAELRSLAEALLDRADQHAPEAEAGR